MEHQLLQNISSINSDLLSKLFKEYDLHFGAIYRLSGKELTLLVASDIEGASWPASTPFNHNYTTNFSARLPVGWVKLNQKVKGLKIWPKGVNFYYPVQNDFGQRLLFVIKPVNSRVKTGTLNVVLEVLSSRIHHIMSSRETTTFVSESVYQFALGDQTNKISEEIRGIKNDSLVNMRNAIDRLDNYIEEGELTRSELETLSKVTNNLESAFGALSKDISELEFKFTSVNEGEEEYFDIGEVSMEACEAAQIEGEGKITVKAVVSEKGSLECVGDSHKIKEAIEEVCINSVLYSARNHVELSIYKSGTICVIDIEDDGPGVKEGLENIIFLKYYRRETIKSLHNASIGLGLDFARSIAKAHGGDLIHIRTSLGKSVFRFMLPLYDGGKLAAAV
jgi:signal transduction histidine kinase